MSKSKEQRNKIIFGLFIIFLMVSSTAGFIYSGGSTQKINGFKFTNVGDGWQVWIEELNSYLIFRYLPNEINFDFDFLDNSSKFKILNKNWDQSSLEKLRTALLFRSIQTEIIDDLNCEEYTLVLNNLYSDLVLTKEQKCFYIEGDSLKFVEGVIYKVFKVI